jgi:hypothetical protein
MANLARDLDAEVDRVTRYALRTASELRIGRRSPGDAALVFLVLCRLATVLVCGLELRGGTRDRCARWPAMTDALWALRDAVYPELRDRR